MTMTLEEWETAYRKVRFSDKPAVASRLPFQSGDGYSFGGAAIVTIGDSSIVVGEFDGAFEVACEIARRWNMPMAEQIAALLTDKTSN